jgi:hypothetical protein
MSLPHGGLEAAHEIDMLVGELPALDASLGGELDHRQLAGRAQQDSGEQALYRRLDFFPFPAVSHLNDPPSRAAAG